MYDGIVVVAIVVLWVDDMLFCGTSTAVEQILRGLEPKHVLFQGPPASFLGLKVERRDEGVIRLSQERHVIEILERYGMKDCKPKAQVMPVDSSLTQKMEELDCTEEEMLHRRVEYRGVIGSLFGFVQTLPLHQRPLPS